MEIVSTGTPNRLAPPTTEREIDAFVCQQAQGTLVGINRQIGAITTGDLAMKAVDNLNFFDRFRLKFTCAEKILQQTEADSDEPSAQRIFAGASATVIGAAFASVLGGPILLTSALSAWVSASAISWAQLGLCATAPAEIMGPEMAKRSDKNFRAEFSLIAIREAHTILTEFVRLHRVSFTNEQLDTLENCSLCPITQEFPLFPVFASYDKNFSQPFECSAICEHLRLVEAKIAACDPNDADRIAQLRATCDPIQRRYLTIGDLKINFDHLKNRALVMRAVLDEMVRDRSSSHRLDAVQEHSLGQILDFFGELIFSHSCRVDGEVSRYLKMLGIPSSEHRLIFANSNFR